MQQESPTMARASEGSRSLRWCWYVGLMLTSLSSQTWAQRVPHRPPADASAAVETESLMRHLGSDREPGLVIGVASGGKTIFTGALGLADVEHGVSLTPDTPFHLASLSKQFTGLAIFALADAGKLSLSIDIHRYLPELPNFGSTISINQMLHMESGLKDFFVLARLSGYSWGDYFSQRRVLTLVYRLPHLDFEPGKRFAYSNTNYALLAQIVAQVTGSPFRLAMKRLVFGPLGMNQTFVHDNMDELIPHAARSYYREGESGPWRKAVLSYELYGGTGVWSTLSDMLKWGGTLSLQRDGMTVSDRLSRPAGGVVTAEHPYGAGLMRSRVGEFDSVEHGGADAGYRHFLVYVPARDLSVIVLGNRVLDAQAVCERVALIWLGVPREDAEPERSAAAQPTQLHPFIGTFAGGDTDNAIQIEERNRQLHVRASPGAFGVLNDEDNAAEVIDPKTLSLLRDTVRLTLRRDVSGKILGIEEHNHTNPLVDEEVFRRKLVVRPYAPTALEDFAGVYRNDALDASYIVKVDAQRLILSSTRDPEGIALEPVAPDRFEGWDYALRTVTFSRRAQKVLSLSVTSDRAMHIVFRRVSDSKNMGSRPAHRATES